jgi:hypothetical protein
MKNFVSQNIAIHPIAKADGLSGDGIVKLASDISFILSLCEYCDTKRLIFFRMFFLFFMVF